MQSSYRSRLRFRLLVLVLFIALPMLGLILFIDRNQRQTATENAQQNIARLTSLAASDVGQNIEGARQFMLAASHLDVFNPEDSSACSDVFTRLLVHNPIYVSLAASTLDGEIFCSGAPLSGSTNLADRTHFKNAIASKDFAIGDYIVSRITGKEGLAFAYPVLDVNDQVAAVITAVLDFNHINRIGPNVILTPGSAFSVIDHTGTILARHPDSEQWVGRSLPDARLHQHIFAEIQGLTTLAGVDGIQRIYGFAPVNGTTNALFVTIGTPEASILAQVDQALQRNLFTWMLVVLVASGAALLFGSISVTQPINKLVDATRRLAGGDMSARVKTSGGDEIHELGEAFNQMAVSLEERTQALRQAEENYRTLVEQIPAITYRTRFDGSSSTIYISPQVEEILGYSPMEIVAKPELWRESIYPEDRQRVIGELTNVAEGQSWHSKYRMVRRDGSVRWFRDEGILLYDSDQNGMVMHGVMFDITDQQQAQETMRREHNLMERIMETSPAGILVFDGTGQVIFANQMAETVLGMSKEDILEHPFENSTWELADLDGSPLPVDNLPFKQVLLTGQPVYNLRFGLFIPQRGRVMLSVNVAPLLNKDGRVDGVISTLNDITDGYQHSRDLEALVSVTSALRDASVLDGIFPIALNQILDLFNADGAAIATVDPVNGDVVMRLGYGEWAGVTGQRLQSGSGLTSQVIETGKPHISWDTQSEPHLLQSARQAKLRFGVCLPLNTHGQTIGAMWVGKLGPITEHDMRLLTAIADITANTIYRVSLYEQTQQRLKRLSALHAIDIAITTSLDLQVTLDVFLDQVIAHMGVHAADVLLLDPELHILEYAAGRGLMMMDKKPIRLQFGESFAGRVAADREVLSIPNLQEFDPPLPDGLQVGGEQFIAYFATPLIAKGLVKGVLELFHRVPLNPDLEWFDFLETLATQAAIAIDSAELFTQLQRSNDELTLAYDATIEGWSHALELRDQETQGHTQRVTDLTLELARFMGIRDPELGHYRRGVLLHDIGKMAIPDGILLKPGPLSPAEREIMRRHPRYAYDLLFPVPYLRPALDIPYAHHERWDGKGYPRGLKGVEIPLPARIFAVVDVWDALRSERPYRSAWSTEKACNYIHSHAGTHFDPQVVNTFLELVRQNYGFVQKVTSEQK